MEIYYIEDDENIAMAVKEYLRQKEYAVAVFGSLEKGRKALEHHVPGLVLIDWNMPDGKGNSFWISALRSSYYPSPAPWDCLFRLSCRGHIIPYLFLVLAQKSSRPYPGVDRISGKNKYRRSGIAF